MNNRQFYLPDGAGYVLFDEPVLTHMYGYAQKRWLDREAGGQLFSHTPHDSAVIITHATGPHRSDVRRRHAFIPDARRATADRHSHFAEGRYAVGLWHTHPEANPMPSVQDRVTAMGYLDAFEGAMTGFLLVILGNQGSPLHMALWLARADHRSNWLKLVEA